eukprot:2112154-Amphidinium_carterae.1
MAEFRQVLATASGTKLEPPGKSLSSIRHDLLSGLARCFNDPGDEITHWLLESAPAGLVRHFSLDRTFEKIDDFKPLEPGDLHTDFDMAVNNPGFDDDDDDDTHDDAMVDAGYRERGFLEEFVDVQGIATEASLKSLLMCIKPKDILHHERALAADCLLEDPTYLCKGSEEAVLAAQAHPAVRTQLVAEGFERLRFAD